ncbi:MAG: ATP-binding cassette domain-containing protein, partial [Microvirgula sp.]
MSVRENLNGAALDIRAAGKRFGPRTVLDGLNLHVPVGQFIAVVGRSGCGKSTLLRLVAGLDRLDDGELN